MAIHWIDLVIVATYLVGITGIGVWFARHQRDSSAGYFLASRSLGWVTVGLALFATNISTVHLTGLAGAGFSGGMDVGNFEWLAPFLLILLGLVFAPFYFRSRVTTLPEYLEGRYGPNSRTVLAFMAVVGALFIHIGVTIYAGAEVMRQIIRIETPDWWAPITPWLDFNIAISISIVSLLTVVYTVLGGLKAVVVTESIQTVLLLLGAAAVTVCGLARLGETGTTSLAQLHARCLQQQSRDAQVAAAGLRKTAETFEKVARLQAAGRADEAGAALRALGRQLKASLATGAVLAELDKDKAHKDAHGALAKSIKNKAGESIALQGVDFVAPVAALVKAAAREADRVESLKRSAQSDRPYSTRLSMVRAEGQYAWWIMLLGYPVIGLWYWCADQTIVQRVLGARSERDAQLGPIFAGFIKVLPVFLMVFPGVMAYVLFRDKIGENGDGTLGVLILELLPRGVQGLVLAGLLAAMMSTVAGALNSAATLVSIDIVQRLRPQTADRTLVRIGQTTAMVVMIAAVAWSTQGERFGGIFQGINQMIAMLSPPISAVFIWGIFWRRGTSAAAFTTLMVGFALGLVVFVMDFPAFGIEIITKKCGIPYVLQAWWLICACSAVFVVVSLLTPPPAPERVEKYCWKSPLAVLTERRISGVSDPRILAVALVVVMAVCYWVFA